MQLAGAELPVYHRDSAGLHNRRELCVNGLWLSGP